MAEGLEHKIREYITSKTVKTSKEIKHKILERLKLGYLTRDENSASHFCVFFVAIDTNSKEVFMGLHKKSGLWLPNGGHIDMNETLSKAVKREIFEEWGENSVNLSSLKKPELFTIQEIENTKQTCKEHYDIWYFINVSKSNFQPNQLLLEKEYFANKWISFVEAKSLNTSEEVIVALDYLISQY